MKQLFLFLLMMISITLSSQKLNQIQKGTARNQITVSNGVNPVNGAPNYTLVYRDALPYILDTLGVRDTIISDFPACCLDSIFLDENHLYYIYEGDTLDVGLIINKDSLYTNGDPGHISIIGSNEVDINVNDADSNPTNEIQTLSFSMPNLSIGGGNTVNLTGLINDADSNPYNELQTISIIDSTDRVFQIRLHPENQLIKFRDSVGLTEMDTSLISQIISDSLSTYVFETDTSLINQLISDSLATINQDQIVSLTGAGITNVTGTYPNFTITSTEVDGSTTNEIQTLSQSFTGTTEATYTLSNSGGSVKDTTGFMRLETMFSTPGSRTYRYKSNLGAILGITEDPLLGGNSNIEVLRTGNQLTWGLRKDNASNGQIYKYNGTSWALSSDVSGITSLNGLTPSTQTFATGTSGTDFNISSATSTHTFNFPTASASNRGLLSSANWTTFNNKLGSLNGLTSATQTFSVTTNANDFTITSSGSNHAFNLPFTGNNAGIRLGLNSLRRDNSVALGISCMQNSGASAANNIAIGNDVLKVAGSTGSGGTNNVGLGFQSLLSLTTGIDNMAIGTYSLANLTSGAQNVGIGTIAGLTLTNQSNNVFIGYEAGRFNTGSGSVFIGNQAGRSITASNKLNIDNTDTSSPLIGGDFSTNSAIINGNLTVTTRTGTATALLGNDANGKLINLGHSNGLVVSGGNLNLPAGVTTGNFLRWNGTAWASDVPIFSFGVSGSTTNISCNSTMNALIAGGTNMTATNSSGTVTVSTDVSYGYMNTTATTQSMTAGSSYKIALTNEINNGVVTASNANDRFTVSATGIYEIHYDLGFAYASGSSSNILELSVQKNGTGSPITGTTSQSFSTASATPVNTSRTVIASLNATDYIELFAQMASGTISVTYNFGNFSIKRID